MASRKTRAQQALASGPSLTRPFDFADYLEAPRFRIDTVPFLDFAFLILFFLFLSSPRFFTPGISIDLPELQLPASFEASPDVIATVTGRNIITPAGVFPHTRTEDAMAALHRRSREPEPTLLLILDRSVPFDTLALLGREARAAGFARVHLAVREPEPAPEP